jgi:hypothetical protein
MTHKVLVKYNLPIIPSQGLRRVFTLTRFFFDGEGQYRQAIASEYFFGKSTKGLTALAKATG